MLPSSGRSIGTKSVTALPANKSLIVADSRFRAEDTEEEGPYNFVCNLGGTGIYAKEIYYNRLQWNQPLFSHNNASVELRFQMNNDTSTTYVVYALPFTMYTAFDGNPPGSSFLAPQTGSYADMMTRALNGDVRTIPNNLTLVPGPVPGNVSDSLGNVIRMNFLYSPTKGFAIFPTQNPLYPQGYTIKLLPCSYIANAHYVHGFGVYMPGNNEFVPRDAFVATYFSDATPTLLPTRYIVVNSPELNKDRRLISFHNGDLANFVNELAIFALNFLHTGTYHAELSRVDSTVVSLRDEYTPQRFLISILNEFGKVLQCDDPIATLITSGFLSSATVQSYVNFFRGDTRFVDALIFGQMRINDSIPSIYQQACYYNAGTPWPDSMYNGSVTFRQRANQFQVNFPDCLPVRLLESGFPTPSEQRASGLEYLFRDNRFSVFGWYYNQNPQPAVSIGLYSQTLAWVGAGVANLTLYMADYYTDSIIGSAIIWSNNIVPGTFINIPSPATVVLLNMNPSDYNPNPQVPVRFVKFYVGGFWKPGAGLVSLTYSNFGNPPTSSPYYFVFSNPNNTANIQTQYIPPPVDASYAWGNPLADGKCEELIHEITSVLEYN